MADEEKAKADAEKAKAEEKAAKEKAKADAEAAKKKASNVVFVVPVSDSLKKQIEGKLSVEFDEPVTVVAVGSKAFVWETSNRRGKRPL